MDAVKPGIERSRGPGRPARNREEFLDAARAVFSRENANEVTMDQLAAAASSTKPTLYRHFASKQALLEAVLTREADGFRDHLYGVYETAVGLPLGDQLKVCFSSFTEYAAANSDGFSLLFGATANQPATAAREELIESLAVPISTTVRRFGDRTELEMTLSADLIGRMLIGLAVFVTQYALLRTEVPPAMIAEVATAFSEAAIRNIEVQVLQDVDRAGAGGAPDVAGPA